MRVIKVVESTNVGLPTSYGYVRKELRVVECEDHQEGLLSEKEVFLIWRSPHYDPFSKGPRSNYHKHKEEAEKIAAVARLALSLGLRSDTPKEIVFDAQRDSQDGISIR